MDQPGRRPHPHRPAEALGPAGHSDLVQLDRRTVGVLYETGRTRPYDWIEFRRLTSWRTGRSYSW
ncbi:hypothetical protein ACIQVT_12080 [Streptomyces sp. NPDC100445]|uniref:hypothetical protein n=1 Tax=Streptomyces sp. NPDC100445 TaxID=3366102 RepID=UPI0037FCD3B8